MSLKFDNFLQPFRGNGDDFGRFWDKFLVLANIQGWDTDDKKVKNFPLFLTDDAFLVFSRMPASDQKDKDKVLAKMGLSFTLTKAQAYARFTSRTMRVDESPDAYVADLQRLSTMAGHKADDDKDPMIIEQLIKGLPVEFARELRLTMAGKELSVTGCLDVVRALKAATSDHLTRVRGDVVVAAATTDEQACFNCGGVGHMARQCPKAKKPGRKSGAGKGTRGERTGPRTCYFCDKPGHMKSDCPERKAWQERKSSGAATAADSGSLARGACLCTVAEATRASLPRIYVDVRGVVGSEWARARAAVDTCASYTMVTVEFLKLHKIPFTAQPRVSVVSVDSSKVKIRGAVDLELQRQGDGAPVSLPRVRVNACVVDSLTAVAADLLLGADVIAGVGGVRLSYGQDGEVNGVCFGPQPRDTGAAATAAADVESTLRHVDVTEDDRGVTLKAEDGELRWDNDKQHWTLHWQWRDGQAPTSPIGSGIGQYARHNLSDKQESQFCDEMDAWVENGYLIEYDEATYGPPAAIIPLLAKDQAHKESTPVRPCLDYRGLNAVIKSNPGTDAPACGEKIRKWRQVADSQFELVDIRKAYLQVRVDPSLLRYQVVVWRGKLYAMSRMGFGLSIAPKFMDIIVRWVTRRWPDVDNYVDDVLTPAEKRKAVAAELARYGLPTKPPEHLPEARVLGLKLSTTADGTIMWARRDGVDLSFRQPLTKRGVFQWTGRLTSHYPVCAWLRPACSMLKRLSSAVDRWDTPVPPSVLQCADEVAEQLSAQDPVRGVWHASAESDGDWAVFCDASDLAVGVVLQLNGQVIEDGTWLRDTADKKHINVAELDAAVRGLSLAAQWHLQTVRLVTDSKTVYGWLKQVLGNVRRVKVGGLHKILVERRLEVIADLVQTVGLKVRVEWVPTDQNPADELTRVPRRWPKGTAEPSDVCSVSVATDKHAIGPVTLSEIKDAQQADTEISQLLDELKSGTPLSSKLYRPVRDQLLDHDGVLMRSVKLPLDGVVQVPVIPPELEDQVLKASHKTSGHATWTTMHDSLRKRCYMPLMAEKCQSVVQACVPCSAANPARGPTVEPTRPDVPGRPWEVIQIDTLELGQSGAHHCCLVCVDMFTKWAEVQPLRRHDAASVAAALTKICCRWGPPSVIRMDNGTEFRKAVVAALLEQFGVVVKTGAVRHPQSQGGVERLNRTIIGLLRKALEETSDWTSELELVLFYYNGRRHATTGISPRLAIMGWEGRDLVIDHDPTAYSASEWVDRLAGRAARIRDLVESLLSSNDSVSGGPTESPYRVDDPVMLRRPERSQKLMTPYESGWTVLKIVSPSTLVIQHADGREKVVNVDIVKPGHAQQVDGTLDDGNHDAAEDRPEPAACDNVVSIEFAADMPTQRYDLRGPGNRRQPARYSG